MVPRWFLPALVLLVVIQSTASEACGAPQPKVGLLFRKSEADAVRTRLNPLLTLPVVSGPAGIRTVADAALKDWPEAKAQIEPHLTELLDLEPDRNPTGHVPDAARDAAKQLTHFVRTTANLGFVYFLTGEPAYAKTAYEIMDAAGRVPRWGWFNWDGVNVPQIPFAIDTRNVAFAVDLCWDGWDESQRRKAVEILAERGVEPYWRLVSLSPFMGLHHLRSKNQGNNCLSAALIASLVVGDSVPENRVWSDSLLQTYCWIIAHDVGWAGTNLESGLPGYWEVSMQNLYTAAACLFHARGIDLRVHPAFAEATWYPVMKEATVPPHAHGRFDHPYPKHDVGLSGTIQHKPIELPSPAYGSSWWYDYAARFPESPAAYFISKEFQNRIADAHQEGHSGILDLLWVRTMEKPDVFPKPATLFKTTDREAMFRSGYGSPHTFLSFNGDLFLSARNEVLGFTSGLSWHFPWHQYAVTESVVETEGELFSPSMVIADSFDGRFVSALHADSGPSNVKYYPRAGQAVSHHAYRNRSREIFYVRSDDRDQLPDYFVFVDRIAQDGQKWHAFNWHIWSQAGNEGRYEQLDDHTMLARRPNASLLLTTLSHDRMTYEEQAIPSQPTVAYEFDHNARLLRAIAGPSEPPREKSVTIAAAAWENGERVSLDGRDAVLFEDFSEPEKKRSRLRSPLQLQPGCRYRVSLSTRKSDARIYENFAWTINLKLLDADGKTVADAAVADASRDPHPLQLTCPASNQPNIDAWRETTTHFTAPEGVAAVEATFLPATYGHATSLKKSSRVWLSDLTFTPLGVPTRTESEFLVMAAIPLEIDGPRPQVRTTRRGDTIVADIVHANGASDRLSVGPSGRFTVFRRGTKEQVAFGWNENLLPVGDFSSGNPIHAEMWSNDGALSGIVSVREARTVRLGRKEHRLEPGSYRLKSGRFERDLGSAALDRNSPASQEQLKAGLAPLAERIIAERDKYVRQGWKNIALDAMVKASGERDARFAAKNLIDNRTWEVPIDGVVDYTLGTITTPGNGGYGRGPVPWDSNLSTWSLYFRPTYWLLPERETGEVTLTLKSPSRLRMVRLLNTSNAGLNDFAAVRGRLFLMEADGRKIDWKAFTFGKPWDRAFEAAFARPEFFKAYGDAFRGILEPGVAVPFGAGWQDIEIDATAPVNAIRIAIDGYWAFGGGLNEVQVYAQ